MAGDRGGGLRVVARAYLVLGLLTVCFALFFFSHDPAPPYRRLQLQSKDSDKHQLVQDLTDMAAMVEEVMQTRADAVLVLLLAMAQGLLSMAAVVASSRVGIFLSLLVSVPLAWRIAALLAW